MSGSFARPSDLPQAFRASLKVEPEEASLSNALHDVEKALDKMQRQEARHELYAPTIQQKVAA